MYIEICIVISCTCTNVERMWLASHSRMQDGCKSPHLGRAVKFGFGGQEGEWKDRLGGGGGGAQYVG